MQIYTFLLTINVLNSKTSCLKSLNRLCKTIIEKLYLNPRGQPTNSVALYIFVTQIWFGK